MSKIDTERLLRLLRSNPKTAYMISNDIGISRTTIANLRNGKKDVDSLTIKVAKVIQNYLEENKNDH